MTDQIYTGFLKTAQFDENDNPIKKPVSFVMPNRARNNLAFELSKPDESRGEEAAMIAAAQNQARVCLVAIDGVAVNVISLEGKKLDQHLESKQFELILSWFRSMTTATKGDVTFCYNSVRVAGDGSGDKLRKVKLPTGDYDGDTPVFRHVVFELPTRTILAKAAEMARQFEGRSSIMVSSESELNVLRLLVREIDGKAIKLDDLRGDLIDERLSQKEQSCLVQTIHRLMAPDKAEKEDFLSSVVVGQTTTEKVTTFTGKMNTAQAGQSLKPSEERT